MHHGQHTRVLATSPLPSVTLRTASRASGDTDSIGVVTTSATRDTPPEVFDALVEQWRAMSPYQRAVLADRLSTDVVTLARAGIRARHPGIGNAELARELALRRYGSTLTGAAYRSAPGS